MICKKCFAVFDDSLSIYNNGMCDYCNPLPSDNMRETLNSDTKSEPQEQKHTTYHERLVLLIKALGETLIENAESIVPADTTLLGGLNIYSNLSHNDAFPVFDVTLNYNIRNAENIVNS